MVLWEMPDKFKSIADILNEDPGLAPVRKIIKQSDVILEFFNIFPAMKKLIRPLKVEKKLLIIHVEDSILRSELKFQEELIISRVNKYFNEERIKGIRFQ
jgi:hypothetical protein